MKACQTLHAFVSFSGQFHLHPASVAAANAAPDQSDGLTPRNQRHNPVLLRLQALGEFSYRRPFPARKAFDLEQEQVLQRRDSIPARYLFTEAEKTAQLIAEMRKLFKIAFCHTLAVRFRSHFSHNWQCIII